MFVCVCEGGCLGECCSQVLSLSFLYKTEMDLGTRLGLKWVGVVRYKEIDQFK